MTAQIISQEYLQEIFDYKDGNLYWKKSRSKINIGNKTGSLSGNGYLCTKLNGKSYRTHRLIYIWHHGFVPECLDHKDGNKLNNNIENLRPATQQENNRNKKLHKNNTSGIKGVYKVKSGWRVRLIINKKSKSFGCYKNIDYAKFVADAMRYKYHKEFARTK